MPEGSVIVEGIDAPPVEVDESEGTQGEIQETEESQEEPQGETRDTDETDETSGASTLKDSEEQPVLTEKGTKLDPNPMSALNQQLANERRIRATYEAVLNDPRKYAQFVKQAGIATEQKSEFKEITVDDISSAEDYVKHINEIKKHVAEVEENYKQQVSTLAREVMGLNKANHAETVYNSVARDVALVQQTYDELKPESPIAKELEKEINERYHELNFDEQTGEYTNVFPLAKVAEMVIRPIRLANKQATQKAQTIIKDKSRGKVVTSGKTSSTEATEDDSIAAQISKAYRR